MAEGLGDRLHASDALSEQVAGLGLPDDRGIRSRAS